MVFVGVSWEYCPFLFGLYSSLVIAWIHPFHLPHSSVSNCVLLEDLFSVSHLTVSYHMWKWNLYSLWCFVCLFFFSYIVCTNLLRCQLWNLFLWHLSYFWLHRVPFCFNFVGQSQFTVHVFLHCHRNLQISADGPLIFLTQDATAVWYFTVMPLLWKQIKVCILPVIIL